MHAVYTAIFIGAQENPKILGLSGETGSTGKGPISLILERPRQDFQNKSCGGRIGSLQWAGMLGKEGRTSKGRFSGRSRMQEAPGQSASGASQLSIVGRTRAELPLACKSPPGPVEERSSFSRTRHFFWFSDQAPEGPRTRDRQRAGEKPPSSPFRLAFRALPRGTSDSWGCLVSPWLSGLKGPRAVTERQP